jgi:hypothetical protein
MSLTLQIVLPDELADRIRDAAIREGVSMEEILREAAEQKLETVKPDPFAAITGIWDSPETDLAARHDEILYGGQ